MSSDNNERDRIIQSAMKMAAKYIGEGNSVPDQLLNFTNNTKAIEGINNVPWPTIMPMDIYSSIGPRDGIIEVQARTRYNENYAFQFQGDRNISELLEFMNSPPRGPDSTRSQLKEAKDSLKQLTELLETIKAEPLICQRIDKISKDKKHCYIKKGDTELRIVAPKDLVAGDEVLLHPKTFQVVERLGRPPLEISRFVPDITPNIDWSDIGGLDQAKADLREAIEIPHLHKDLFAWYGQRQVKGILLSGPPGCGKTMLGKAVSTALAKIHSQESSKTGFLYVKGPEILNMYVGSTEQTIRDMFYDAQRHKEEYGYPAVIFIDEADAILAARGSRNIGIGNTIVPMFLTEMDGLEESGAIVIIATNRPDVLDPAIVRDGRIDRKIAVTRPNQDIAKEILMLNLKKCKVDKGNKRDIMADEIAAMIWSPETKVSERYWLRDIVNGAMLANIVNLAASTALQRDLKNETRTGVRLEECLEAVRRIATSAHSVLHELETMHD